MLQSRKAAIAKSAKIGPNTKRQPPTSLILLLFVFIFRTGGSRSRYPEPLADVADDLVADRVREKADLVDRSR